MIILNFRNQKQVKLRKIFLSKLKELGIKAEKCESEEENCSQYKIQDNIEGNVHSQMATIFANIGDKLSGVGHDSRIPLGCIVWARSWNDDPRNQGQTFALLYYYLPPKKVRKKKYKKYEPQNLVDVFG